MFNNTFLEKLKIKLFFLTDLKINFFYKMDHDLNHIKAHHICCKMLFTTTGYLYFMSYGQFLLKHQQKNCFFFFFKFLFKF